MGQLNTAPSSRKKKEDDEFYDYEAARRAGVTGPDKSGHWPSDFKKDGHPNLIVGGFNTKTGKRVIGTKQASESELRDSGWDAKSAKHLTETNTGEKHSKDVDLPLDTSPSDKKKKKK